MTVLLMLALFGSGSAFASDAPVAPIEHAPAANPAAVEGAVQGHGGGDAHGGGHGEQHVYYSGDTDHDGVPNWRDPTNGAVPNEESYVVWTLGFHAFNFLLLLALGVVFVRRPVMDTFRTRALGIRNELTESARRRDEAHQRHQELLARLDKIETEVQAMEAEAEVDAKREEAKLIERAEREAARIVEQAERNIRDETRRARIELRSEAVELAVQLARSTLAEGVTKKDQQALARDFLSSIQEGDRV
jgi:F-type H+-transporting ATPase subunit b